MKKKNKKKKIDVKEEGTHVMGEDMIFPQGFFLRQNKGATMFITI